MMSTKIMVIFLSFLCIISLTEFQPNQSEIELHLGIGIHALSELKIL